MKSLPKVTVEEYNLVTHFFTPSEGYPPFTIKELLRTKKAYIGITEGSHPCIRLLDGDKVIAKITGQETLESGVDVC